MSWPFFQPVESILLCTKLSNAAWKPTKDIDPVHWRNCWSAMCRTVLVNSLSIRCWSFALVFNRTSVNLTRWARFFVVFGNITVGEVSTKASHCICSVSLLPVASLFSHSNTLVNYLVRKHCELSCRWSLGNVRERSRQADCLCVCVCVRCLLFHDFDWIKKRTEMVSMCSFASRAKQLTLLGDLLFELIFALSSSSPLACFARLKQSSSMFFFSSVCQPWLDFFRTKTLAKWKWLREKSFDSSTFVRLMLIQWAFVDFA